MPDHRTAGEDTSKIWQKGYLWKQSGGAKTADGRAKRSLGSTRRKWDRRWFVLVEGVRPLGSRVKTAVVCVYIRLVQPRSSHVAHGTGK